MRCRFSDLRYVIKYRIRKSSAPREETAVIFTTPTNVHLIHKNSLILHTRFFRRHLRHLQVALHQNLKRTEIYILQN